MMKADYDDTNPGNEGQVPRSEARAMVRVIPQPLERRVSHDVDFHFSDSITCNSHASPDMASVQESPDTSSMHRDLPSVGAPKINASL